MEIKKGIGVSPGVAISTALMLDTEDLVIPKRQVPKVEKEAPRKINSKSPSVKVRKAIDPGNFKPHRS